MLENVILAYCRLQSVLNAAARLVFAGRIHDHVTPLLQELHWLRARQRITYKLAMIVYRCLHGLAPQYLAGELTRVADIESRRRLRSAATARLDVPSVQRSTIGGRAFPVAAAVAWNSLPSSVTSSPSLETFRRMLKTELFVKSFPTSWRSLLHFFICYVTLKLFDDNVTLIAIFFTLHYITLHFNF